MAFRSCIASMAITLVLAACSTGPTAPSAPTVASRPGAALLLRDGATVAMTFQSGPGATAPGERGPGLFTNTYRASSGTFGPATVTSHRPDTLTFRTRSTSCTLAPEGVVTCADGSRGAWNAV